MFVFKIYSNGHPNDTSVAWLQFFSALITSHYVPAILFPRNFPNVKMYTKLVDAIDEEMTISQITLK